MRNIQKGTGYLNIVFLISPIYQAIQHPERHQNAFGAGDALLFEPLLLEILSHFSKLHDAYQASEEEK